MADAAITVREALRMLLAADAYPRLGNHDWHEADLMEAAALHKASTAVPENDDPSAFAHWMATLLKPDLQNSEREEVYSALHDFFDETEPHRSPVMASIHDTAEGLHAAGVMDKQTMQKFDDACLTAMPPFTPEEIRALRKR